MGKRRNFKPEFKAKVAIEAAKGMYTLSELAQKYNLHPNQISKWKKELEAHASELFSNKRGPKTKEIEEEKAKLYEQIGRLQMELEWLKKKSGLE